MTNSQDALRAANRLCQAGRVAEAAELCQRATREFPWDPGIHNMLGLCYFSMRQALPAIETFRRAVEIEPRAAHLHHNLGLALQMADRWQEALVEYRRATELSPADEPGYIKLAELLLAHGMTEEAIERLERGVAYLSQSLRLWLTLATARVSARDAAGAEAAYKRALEISPAAANSYGFWLQVEGRLDEAFEVFERSRDENPKQGVAYYALLDRKETPGRLALRLGQMEPLVDDPALGEEDRLYLLYALGKAYDQTGQYELAMRSFDLGNELAFRMHMEGRPFDREAQTHVREVTTLSFDAPTLAARASEGCPTTRPIFIVGMIRSGTTLLDQILTSHPEVAGGGELRFWMEEPPNQFPFDRIGEDAIADMASRYLAELDRADLTRPYVTDKMPLNFNQLGLIHLVFPRAKILHIRRDPVDTCLSIYMNYFGAGPNFTYRKDNIVFYYREYLRLMEHWRSVIPASQLIEVDYEELVGSPESTIRQVIAACGLPWDDACLRHHTKRGTVNTPSRWQVRQPVYTTSTDRWRRYEPWLGAFAELLTDKQQ